MTLNILQGYNLDNFEAGFREFLITENVSQITLKNYLSDLRHFLGWFTLHLSSVPSVIVPEHNDNQYSIISLLDIATVKQYKDYLETNNIPVKTINRRLSTVRKFCSFCVSQGWLKENPARELTNAGTKMNQVQQQPVRMNVEIEDNNSLNNNELDSPVHLLEFQKTLSHLPQNEAQMILQDIKEFFNITNLFKTV